MIRRLRPALRGALIVGCLSLLGAGPELRAVVVGPSSADPRVVRLRQELALLGFDVEVATSLAQDDPAKIAADREAAAVLRVVDIPPEIAVWVDAAHSKNLPQEVHVRGAGGDADTAALRAVEWVRGRFVPVDPTKVAPTASPSAAPTASASASAIATSAPTASAPSATASASASPPELTASKATLHIGPAIAGSPGKLPPMPVLRIGGAWRARFPLELATSVLVPLAAATASAPEGTVDLRVLWVGLGANVHLLPASSRFSIGVGAGLGLAVNFFEGHAILPWISASGVAITAAPYLGAHAGFRFTPQLGIRADLGASVAWPEPVIVIAGREAASFGVPMLSGGVALEVHL